MTNLNQNFAYGFKNFYQRSILGKGKQKAEFSRVFFSRNNIDIWDMLYNAAVERDRRDNENEEKEELKREEEEKRSEAQENGMGPEKK